MTLDDMQTTWKEYDDKLDTVVRLNRALLNERSLNGTRTALRRQMRIAVAGGVVAWTIIPLMGVFVAFNHSSVKFVLPALLIAAFFGVNMLVHIRQARALACIDCGQPVTVIQKEIEAVVRGRIRLARWLAMSLVLSWVPISIVLFKGLFGWDLYVEAPRWLLVNALLGLACIPLTLWIARRHAADCTSPAAQRFLHDLAGNNLSAAKAFLATIADFEREERQA